MHPEYDFGTYKNFGTYETVERLEMDHRGQQIRTRTHHYIDIVFILSLGLLKVLYYIKCYIIY